MKVYGRRSSDGLAQALVWVQVLVLAALWAINLVHLAQLGSAVSEAKSVALSMRREVEMTRKERAAFVKSTRLFLESLRDDEPRGRRL